MQHDYFVNNNNEKIKMHISTIRYDKAQQSNISHTQHKRSSTKCFYCARNEPAPSTMVGVQQTGCCIFNILLLWWVLYDNIFCMLL
jgi:hypothetical protein